ncbi:MAG: aminopeptidase [Thiotrichales bacterium SG8_50]|nr:MAG: aminopeptidase [Thiotrichales bacterium SG8_50]
MEISVKLTRPETARTSCLVVGVFDRRHLSDAGQTLDAASGGYLSQILRRGDMDGELEKTLILHNLPHVPAQRVLLIGCGREREFGAAQFRKVVATATKTLNDTGSTDAVFYLSELPIRDRDGYWKVRQAVESIQHTLYQFDELKSKKDDARRPLRRVVLNIHQRRELAAAQRALSHGNAVAQGVALARDLGNLPGNVCTPAYLAEQARLLARGNRKLKVTVLERKDMEKLGMGSLLSVAKGSRQPPKLIALEYKGRAGADKPIALVGKGITFDSGGISIKPAAAMDEMKYDMCGAASVLGTMKAVAAMQAPINVVGIIPTCENLPDGAANKPGDIVTSMSGQTIEVLNTDAEGRLILCDALTYAERFEPKAVVDIATLTGACVIALGKHASGLLSNHDPLTRQLLAAGESTGDRAWELPLWEDYQEQLKSPFADMANIGGREAGTITAACFLARFTKKFKWAHLDIAGTAWTSGNSKGATGRPVPLLTQYLIDRCPKF